MIEETPTHGIIHVVDVTVDKMAVIDITICDDVQSIRIVRCTGPEVWKLFVDLGIKAEVSYKSWGCLIAHDIANRVNNPDQEENKMQTLTQPQKRLLEQLVNAEEIHGGVIWWMAHRGKTGKIWHTQLDGRACNALVRKGVLIPWEDSPTRYAISMAT